MSNKSNILKLSQEFVFDLLKNEADEKLLFHNYNHTVNVVDAAKAIGEESKLSDQELEYVQIAAWFHDTGYTIKYKGHEEESVRIANDFLNKQDYSAEGIKLISGAIMATKFPQNPQNLLESVLCDADFSHFGKKSYLEKANLLRLEWGLMNQTPENDNWPQTDIDFLIGHRFHTSFAQKEYGKRKNKNIVQLQQTLLELNAKREKIKKKEETPEKGIETMFRVSFRNHMHLSSIADSKANIMLSINAIIISISLSTLIPSFEDNPGLIIPTIFLLFVSILTMVFATLSTMPKIESGIFTREDVKKKKPNLLFFGNFHGMPLQEYEWGMWEIMKQKDYLYGALIKDFYSLGTILAKKYKYLRICYHVFMYGIILVVIVFLGSFLSN